MRLSPFLVVLGVLVAAAARADPGAGCPDLSMPPASVPNSRAILAKRRELIVVALGSSSTEGWMASDLAHSYPAILQEALGRAEPNAHIAVINRGIGGQDATEEVTRIDSDVLALRPGLVIWQVGANGVLRSVDPIIYRKLVTEGVRRMEKAGIDVILMDNQRSPAIVEAPEHLVIDQATAEVAAATGASLFARSLLMDSWQRDGATYDKFISPDRMHHNDLGYRCISEALAGSIDAGLRAR